MSDINAEKEGWCPGAEWWNYEESDTSEEVGQPEPPLPPNRFRVELTHHVGPDWVPGHPAEWYDPTFKGLSPDEQFRLGMARAFGHVPPLRRYVYFFHDRAANEIKIGIAESVVKRRKTLQSKRNAQLDCLGCFEGSLRDEADWHARFSADRVAGEWFRATPALHAAIADLAGDLP